jgi:hypothetical protein
MTIIPEIANHSASEKRNRIDSWFADKAKLAAAKAAELHKPLQTAVVGVDVGGTKMAYRIYPVVDGKITQPDETLAKQLAGDEVRFGKDKSLAGFVDEFWNLMTNAQAVAAQQGYVIAGVGMGAPGRFIEKGRLQEYYGGVQENFGTRLKLGDYLGKTEGSQVKVVAPGSAANMSANPAEFDGVALENLLRQFMPAGVPLAVHNDAAVQMKAIVEQLKSDPQEAQKLSGKKLVYIGPGTGLGAAVMNEKGDIVTDGHFQYMTLGATDGIKKYPKGTELTQEQSQQMERAISALPAFRHLNAIRHQDLKKRLPMQVPDITIDRLEPEYLLSGTAVGNLIAMYLQRKDKNSDRSTVALNDPKNTAVFEACLNDSSKLAECYYIPEYFDRAKDAVKGLGHYMGLMLAKLHKADFMHLDPKAQWSHEDKQQVKGVTDIVIGGGFGQTKIFNELMLPEAEKTFLQETGQQLHVHRPKENNVELATLGAAQALDEAALRRTPDEVLARHQENRPAKIMRGARS